MSIRRSSIVLASLVFLLVVSTPVGASSKSTYVALGDSYSSGAGLGPFLAGPAGCSRSPEGYPALVSDTTPMRLDFVACAGATTAQISAQVVSARTALRRAGLVTVTAGGNDLSFSNLLVSCVGGVSSPTSSIVQYLSYASGPAACTAAVAAAAGLLGAKFNSVTGTLTTPRAMTSVNQSRQSPLERRLGALVHSILVASAAGNAGAGAHVVVVDYPVLLSKVTAPICLVGPSPLQLTSAPGVYPAFSAVAAKELAAINGILRREIETVVGRIRHRTARVVVANAATFQPINCTTGTSPDLNGLSVSSLESGGSFHPTASGQAVLAESVRVALRRWSSR